MHISNWNDYVSIWNTCKYLKYINILTAVPVLNSWGKYYCPEGGRGWRGPWNITNMAKENIDRLGVYSIVGGHM